MTISELHSFEDGEEIRRDIEGTKRTEQN